MRIQDYRLSIILVGFFLFFFCTWPSFLQARSKKNNTLAQKKAKISRPKKKETKITLSGFQTLQARFEQRQYYSFMDTPVKSFGKVYLSAHKMVWDTLTPSRSKIVMIGSKAWMLYPSMKGKKAIGAGQQQIMAIVAKNLSLLCRADIDGLRAFYRVSRKGNVWTLTPKYAAMRKLIASLSLTLDPKGFARYVKVLAPDGDYMEVFFSHVVLNKKLPEEVFSYKKSEKKK